MWKNVVAPTLVVILFWGLSNVATAYYIRSLESVPTRMILEDLSTIHAADAMRHALGEINRTMAAANRPISAETAASVHHLEDEFLAHLQEAYATANSPEERAMDPVIQSRFEAFQVELHRQKISNLAPKLFFLPLVHRAGNVDDGLAAVAAGVLVVNPHFVVVPFGPHDLLDGAADLFERRPAPQSAGQQAQTLVRKMNPDFSHDSLRFSRGRRPVIK